MEKIKELREKTGAGMVDCKKALDEAGGDMDKAVELLRKKGIAKAAKRGERDTSEGVVKLAVNEDASEGYILELNSETDFVARNEKFQEFADKTIEIIKSQKPADLDALLSAPMGDGATVGENLDTLSGVIGEKLVIKRFDILSTTGTVAGYSHLGGRIGVLVALSTKGSEELAGDVAMQIAAVNPSYINPEEVPSEETDKEKEIYRAQLLKEGKPENIVEKILEGKINKYYEEVCLTKQEFIKDDKKKICEILGDTKVEKFIRYSL